MYFRMCVDEIQHKRIVFDIGDYLGEIGGIIELLVRGASFIFGGYLAFN